MDAAPDDPWPPDMVLSIVRVDDSALELLWVRAAWALRLSGDDLPPPASVLPELPLTAEGLRRDKSEWQRAWPQLWTAALERSTSSVPPDPTRALDAAAVDRLDVKGLLDALRGPTWRSRFGDDAFGAAYDDWRERLVMRVPPRHGAFPEREALVALVPAWRRGLRTVITLPCTGSCTRTLGPETLLVTDADREDPERYRVALRSFGG